MFEKEVTGMADVPVSVVSRQRFDVNARAATVRPKIQQVISVVVVKLIHVVVPRLLCDRYIDFKTQTFWVMHCLVYRITCFCHFLTLLSIF